MSDLESKYDRLGPNDRAAREAERVCECCYAPFGAAHRRSCPSFQPFRVLRVEAEHCVPAVRVEGGRLDVERSG